ncbi:CLUMA_CG007305, isoform A [Clunio marinus]|uniref:CLUMA_CG007305, isoform A n=1 Tax=Clunio marinus TaxID=568069 RepID=A0A1J1I5W8_9DIPT|nr:CLUMA_CG007305, isoform A [Clunio marinus]
MTNMKSIFILAIATFGMVTIKPIEAQQEDVLNFWLAFAELLTEDVLTEISKIQLPQIQAPTVNLPNIPDLNLPNLPDFTGDPIVIEIPSTINIPPFIGPPSTLPPTSPPSPPSKPGSIIQLPNGWFQIISDVIDDIKNPGPNPTTPKPETTTPCANGCKPDKVKIIVIDDCDERKGSESDEETSDEVDIIVPYERKGRYNYKKYNKK